jgi:putative membrane-bound dehydrogenase-like protein
MRRTALASLLLLLSVASLIFVAAQPPAEGKRIELNGQSFTLPPGFEIELVAGPPLVNRPIVADFDEEGRLYVADSSGTNDPVKQQIIDRPHRIVRLEDVDGDGRFDRATVFADKMMFPEGTMWFAGSLYVSAPPTIWKLTDTDGDGVADRRQEWFDGKTLTGCANDLHGPYLGPDGWIYWCKGAFARQTYERPGKAPFITRAAHIFRARPDGSGIEPVMTGGMDNPVDVVFTPGGERIFTTTFLQRPGGGRRDGLIHAVYGGVYGKDHDVIYEHPWTSPSLMPVLDHLGPAVPSGLLRFESRGLGADYQDNLFAALFSLHKVTRHVLEPNGATFKVRDEDFLVSENLDFHPTDVLEDSDGSLLVIDTGGWYKLCCPSSQLHKPDILGGIYRIRRQGAPRVEDPRGRKLAWKQLTADQLASLLGDPRPAVRRRAMQALADKGADDVPAVTAVMASAPSVEARRNAVWTATRIEHATARAAVRSALADRDETVRQVAAHSASVWRDRGAIPGLLRLLEGSSAHNQRVAAEALGRMGEKSVVPALLDAVSKPADQVLEHSLTFALIEIGDADGTAAGLTSANLLTRRTALTALDQMKSDRLRSETVARELTSADPRMKETAWWIAGHHPEWGGALAGLLRDRLSARELPAAEREELVQQLARFAAAKPVEDLLTERLRDSGAPRGASQIALQAMARAGLKEVPDAWVASLIAVLASDDSELVREALATARALRVSKKQTGELSAALLTIARQSAAPADFRLSALAAVPGGLAKAEPSLFDFLRSQLGSELPVATRSVAAEVLSKAKLEFDQLIVLTQTLKTVGPMEIDRLLEALAQSTDDRVGQALVAALKASSSRSSLRIGAIKPRLEKFGPDVQRQAEELYALLDADAAKQRERLEQMLVLLKDGDIRRGQAVFQSAKAACFVCHAIGYRGGNVGPDLTHIGRVRTERDLLESILFPSASFVRSYEPVLVTTKNGKQINGLIRKDSADEIVLATGANQEERIARADIEDIQPSKISIMPAGLDQQLTPSDLADLVAFLKACK